MHVCTYICVGMCVCIYVRTYVCVCICMYVHMYMYACVYVRVCMYMCIHVRMYVCMNCVYMYVRMYVYVGVSKNSELKYFFLKRVAGKDTKLLIVFSNCEHTKYTIADIFQRTSC
jgi:hypothetical protein